MKKAIILLPVLFFLVLFVSGCTSSAPTRDYGPGTDKVVVYKSASCGCCSLYVPYLQQQGFQVEVVTTENMGAVKSQYGIPYNMQSCHTTVVGGYFVEGHVPVEAIDKLLTEKPEIKGIALPGMPSGSPGMPGAKSGVWKIYAISDSGMPEFMSI